jgi:hypothetical protein
MYLFYNNILKNIKLYLINIQNIKLNFKFSLFLFNTLLFINIIDGYG